MWGYCHATVIIWRFKCLGRNSLLLTLHNFFEINWLNFLFLRYILIEIYRIWISQEYIFDMYLCIICIQYFVVYMSILRVHFRYVGSGFYLILLLCTRSAMLVRIASSCHKLKAKSKLNLISKSIGTVPLFIIHQTILWNGQLLWNSSLSLIYNYNLPGSININHN